MIGVQSCKHFGCQRSQPMILGTLRVPWKMELGGKLPNYNSNESEFKILLKKVYVKPKICHTHEFFTLREFFFQATQCSIIQCPFLPHCGQFKGPFDSGNGFYGKNNNRNESEFKFSLLKICIKSKICRRHEFFTLRYFFFRATQCSKIQD